MADLIGEVPTDGSGHRFGKVLNLYCWPCRTVHAFPLADVERIVYALGAIEQHAYQVAAEDPDLGADLGRVGPSCLKTVLQVAGDPECAAEHVEQGVECREKTDA